MNARINPQKIWWLTTLIAIAVLSVLLASRNTEASTPNTSHQSVPLATASATGTATSTPVATGTPTRQSTAIPSASPTAPVPTSYCCNDGSVAATGSASCSMPGVYDYNFDAVNNCIRQLSPSFTSYFEAAATQSGPWDVIDSHPLGSFITMEPGQHHVFTDTYNIPSLPPQYNWYRIRLYITWDRCMGQTGSTTAYTTPDAPCREELTSTVTTTASPIATSTSITSTPSPTVTPSVSPTSGLFCYANATVGATSCQNPQTGSYSYDATLFGTCGQCEVQSVLLYYTGTLLIAPDINGPFTPYYVGPTRERELRCETVNVTEVLTAGAIPPPNSVYKISVEYRSSAGDHGFSTSQAEPICAQSGTTTATTTATATLTATATPSCQPWAEEAPYPTQDFSLMATSLDGEVYAFGGRDENYVRLTSAYRYDPATNGWTQLADMPQICFWCSAVAVNGQIYIVNGSHDQGGSNSLMIYDPATNSWSAGSSGLMATYGQAVVYLNGVLYRIGGLGDSGYTNTMEDYGNRLLAPMPQAEAWEQAASIGGYIYVAGGSTDGGISNKTYRYDPATDSWDDNAIADLPEGRAWAGGGVVGGRWVIVGGVGTEGSAVAWNPQSNTWSNVAPPLFPRSDMGSAVSGGDLYLVAGLSDQLVGTRNEVTAKVQKYDPAACATPTVGPSTTATASTTARPSPTSCALQFSDVPPGSTFYPYIHCLACLGLINGYPNGTFKPNNDVTRGQLSKIVSNAAGFSDPQPTQMFQDVPLSSTFQLYIGRLASRGYISGYPCGQPGEQCVPPNNLPYFRPNANATRGQISKIVSNAAGFADPPTGQQFQDVAPGSTYYTYTYRLVSRGVMSGYPCGVPPGGPCLPGLLPYFRPNNNATRGQTSKIVSNTFFPDCEASERE